MRISHRVPFCELPSAVLDEAYQAEVDRSTRRGERAYEKAVRDLQRAERKVEQARAQGNKRLLRIAVELAELRREQLVELERMMHAVPASATHRGVKSYRPVPASHGGLV